MEALAIAILNKDEYGKASMADALMAYGRAFRSISIALARFQHSDPKGSNELSIAILCILLSEVRICATTMTCTRQKLTLHVTFFSSICFQFPTARQHMQVG